MLFSLFILAITLSIDAFGIGVAYTIKGVIIPLQSKILVGFISAAIMWGAALTGEFMLRFLPEWCAKYLGIFILFLMGAIFIRNSLCTESTQTYDLDASKRIELLEGILLAIALSADSISVGVAAATLGLSWFFLGIMVGFLQMIFLWVGNIVIKRGSRLKCLDCRLSGMLSGAMLILIGLLRLF